MKFYREFKVKFAYQTTQMFSRYEKLLFVVLNGKFWPLFFGFLASHLCLFISSATFICSFWYKWEFSMLIESIAVAKILNMFLILKNVDALKPLIAMITENRKMALLDDAQKPLAENYRRKENVFLMTNAIMITFAIVAINFLSVACQTNGLQLPLSYYILAFPYDRILSLNWLLNYIHQFIAVLLGGVFFGFNFSLTLLMMNQSCWLIDSTFIEVEKLDESLKSNADLLHTTQCLQKVADMIESIIDWLKRTQNLLKMNFLSEVTLLTLLLCLFSFEMTNSSSGSLIALVACNYMLSQFFVFCWMGSYVTSRLESLVHALQGISWDQMKPKLREDLKFMLLMAQNIKGYHGIFKPIDLATFEDIIKNAYSLLAVLNSSK